MMFYSKEPSVPSNWSVDGQKSVIEVANKIFNFKKVTISKEDPIFSNIEKMIKLTFDSSKMGLGQDAAGLDKLKYSKLVVLKIERIENIELYKRFAGLKHLLFKQLYRAGTERYPNVSTLRYSSGAVKTERLVDSALKENIDPELNEVFLFHGTKKENVYVICKQGFDLRVGSRKSMLGQGIYGAECSLKADQYAGKTNESHTNQLKYYIDNNTKDK